MIGARLCLLAGRFAKGETCGRWRRFMADSFLWGVSLSRMKVLFQLAEAVGR